MVAGKHRYLKINENGSLITFDDIDPETVKEFDAGMIHVVDMEQRQYLEAITRGGLKWQFIERKEEAE